MRFLIYAILVLLVGGTAFLMLWEIPAPVEQKQIAIPSERLKG